MPYAMVPIETGLFITVPLRTHAASSMVEIRLNVWERTVSKPASNCSQDNLLKFAAETY